MTTALSGLLFRRLFHATRILYPFAYKKNYFDSKKVKTAKFFKRTSSRPNNKSFNSNKPRLSFKQLLKKFVWKKKTRIFSWNKNKKPYWRQKNFLRAVRYSRFLLPLASHIRGVSSRELNIEDINERHLWTYNVKYRRARFAFRNKIYMRKTILSRYNFKTKNELKNYQLKIYKSQRPLAFGFRTLEGRLSRIAVRLGWFRSFGVASKAVQLGALFINGGVFRNPNVIVHGGDVLSINKKKFLRAIAIIKKFKRFRRRRLINSTIFVKNWRFLHAPLTLIYKHRFLRIKKFRLSKLKLPYKKKRVFLKNILPALKKRMKFCKFFLLTIFRCSLLSILNNTLSFLSVKLFLFFYSTFVHLYDSYFLVANFFFYYLGLHDLEFPVVTVPFLVRTFNCDVCCWEDWSEVVPFICASTPSVLCGVCYFFALFSEVHDFWFFNLMHSVSLHFCLVDDVFEFYGSEHPIVIKDLLLNTAKVLFFLVNLHSQHIVNFDFSLHCINLFSFVRKKKKKSIHPSKRALLLKQKSKNKKKLNRRKYSGRRFARFGRRRRKYFIKRVPWKVIKVAMRYLGLRDRLLHPLPASVFFKTIFVIYNELYIKKLFLKKKSFLRSIRHIFPLSYLLYMFRVCRKTRSVHNRKHIKKLLFLSRIMKRLLLRHILISFKKKTIRISNKQFELSNRKACFVLSSNIRILSFAWLKSANTVQLNRKVFDVFSNQKLY